MACVRHELPLKEAIVVKAAAATTATYEDATANRLMCKIAADIFELAGAATSPERILFLKLASAPEWKQGYNQFSDAVYDVVGDLWRTRQAYDREMISKQAAMGALATGLARLGLAAGPSIIQTLPLMGVGAGAGAGALWWLANRHAEADDADNTALKAKVDYYKALSGDISAQLSRRGLVEDPNKSKDPKVAKNEVSRSIY